jgi:VWFA-related protein
MSSPVKEPWAVRRPLDPLAHRAIGLITAQVVSAPDDWTNSAAASAPPRGTSFDYTAGPGARAVFLRRRCASDGCHPYNDRMFRALLVLAALGLLGQEPPQQPAVTFKVEINYVEIDAVVSDAQGTFVRGLTKDDFRVTEAGKPQSISALTLVDIPVDRADPPLFRPSVIEPDVASNREAFNGRVFLIVLDDLWTDPARTGLVRAAARQFVRRYVGSNDLVAVVTTAGGTRAAQDFTGSHVRLVAAVDRFVGRKRADSDIERTMMARNAYDALRGLAQYLGGIRGRRKAIVWFGEGVDYNIDNPFESPNADVVRQEMQDTIAAATRANVSFYGVDARGVGAGLDEAVGLTGLPDDTGGMVSVQDTVRRAHNSLRTVSTETGGFAIVDRGDLNAAFEQIVRDNSSYYVLGYYSTDERRDGRFRDVQVRVTRPGLTVKARKGYVAPKGKPRAAEAPLPGNASPALRDALSSPIPTSGLGLGVAAAPFAGKAPKASVAIVVEIDPERLKFVERSGAFEEDLEVVLVAVDAAGKSPDGARDRIPLRLSARTHETVARYGFRTIRRIEVPPGRYQLRVGAREGNGGAIGSLAMDLDVPDFSKEPLAMSGIVLASAWASRIPTANPDPELKDVLPSPPTAHREFPPNDTLAIFADVYDNQGSPSHRVAIAATVTGDDGKVVFTASDERRSDELEGKAGGYGYSATIPLANIPRGRYVLRVEARSTLSKGATSSRELEFRVR